MAIAYTTTMNCCGYRRHSILLMLIYQRINGLTARAHNNVEILFVERFMLLYMRIVCTEMQVTRMTISMLLLILALTLISGNVKFIFHFKMPQIVVRFGYEGLNCSHHTASAAYQKCTHFRDSVHAIYDLYQDMAHVLYGRMIEVRKMLLQLSRYQPSRQTRSFSTWLGSVIGSLFGLATTDDLNKIQTLMQNVFEGAQAAVESWKTGQHSFSRAINITNERFANLETVLNVSRDSITELNNRMTAIRDDVLGNFKITTDAVKHIHSAIRHLQQTEAFYAAIQQLIQGRLSYHLVTLDMFKMPLLIGLL